MSSSVNPLQQLNSIPNAGGNGLPVSQYAQEMQTILQLQLESIPQSQITQIQNQSSALNSLQTALAQLQSAMQTLASSQTWNQVTAASSNPNDFSVTAASGAIPSVYGITVQQLASSQLETSTQGQSSDSGASNLNAGGFTISGSSGTTLATITVTAGESLDAIAQSVNSDTAQTGVSASVIQVGGSTGTVYQLALQGDQSGQGGGFTLQDTSGSTVVSGTGTGSLGMTLVQSAQDAKLVIDGQVSGGSVTGGFSAQSANNTFTNVIPGITINAQNANPTAVDTLTVSSNSSGASQAVQTFMNSYNSVVDLLRKDTLYTQAANGQPAQQGPLIADPNAQSLMSQLPSALLQMVSGSTYTALSQIGIVIDPNTGHLEFQPQGGFTVNGAAQSNLALQNGQTMFNNALASNASAVQQLFGVVSNSAGATAIPNAGVLGNLQTTLNIFLGSATATGTIQSDLTSLQNQQQSVQGYLSQVGQEISQRVQDFTAQLNQLNASLQHSQLQSQSIAAMLAGGAASSGSSSSGNTIP